MKSSGWSPNHVTFVGVLTAFDLLARAGHLDEAVKLINEMKLEPDVVVWKTLLYLKLKFDACPFNLPRTILFVITFKTKRRQLLIQLSL
ncbi:hypothetical protein Bca4012_006065 [Brassica carinata]